MEIVHFSSHRSEETVEQLLSEQRASYRETPGLVQQVFMRDPATGEYAGIYLWDSCEARSGSREFDPERVLAADPRIVGEPRVESFVVMSIL